MGSPSNSTSFSTFIISEDEFKLFHKIDRELYTILAINIGRDPMESLQIMAFWLWLERAGFRNIVFRMLRLPLLLINELADEAIHAIVCIASNHPPSLSDDYHNNIPLTQNFMKHEISLEFLYTNREIALEVMTKVYNDVCVRALDDIIIRATNHRRIAATNPLSPPSSLPFSTINGGGVVLTQVPPEDRAMFVTFSKGYPVREWEVREFFTMNYGDCIEMFQMQEVELDEQALFARIVFRSVETIDLILRGQQRKKFTINGKHIWARKFIPKQSGRLPPPAPPSPPLGLPETNVGK